MTGCGIVTRLFKGLLLYFCAISGVAYSSTDYIALNIVESSNEKYFQPVVLNGSSLKSLLGNPAMLIAVFASHSNNLKMIPFQIDQKNKNGYFVLGNEKDIPKLTQYDECVFMPVDAGNRVDDIKAAFSEFPGVKNIVEVALQKSSVNTEYVYVASFNGALPSMQGLQDYVQYDVENDVVNATRYQLGFDKEKPVLINTMRFSVNDEYSSNMIKAMRVNHKGVFTFFGLDSEFVRTEQDYTSKMTGYKDGLVRVIRKTENSVRMFWILKSPAFSIDYIMQGGGFSMDNAIDMPFSIGTFFDDVTTDMMMAWREDKNLPVTYLSSKSVKNRAKIDGIMQEDEEQINASGDTEFMLSNDAGSMHVSMKKEKGFNVDHRAYVNDGSGDDFGNIGFHTSKWEDVNNDKVHHMEFDILFMGKDKSMDIDNALNLKEGAVN